jgi:hypothetical protein
VSLFRRERLYASVELDRLALVRLGSDGVAREQAVMALPLDPERPDEWRREVEHTLASPLWRDAPCSVVLSDRLVRYAIMERPEGLRSGAELRLACEARFQASFDRPARDWEIALDARAFARHYLACGILRRFLDVIRAVFATRSRLVSVRPFLICELRRVARRLPGDCWFIVAARDCVALAGIAARECRRIRVLAVEQPTAAMIQGALEREMLLGGELAPNAPVLVAGVLQGDLGANAMRRIDAARWGSQPNHWTSGFRVALSERWA